MAGELKNKIIVVSGPSGAGKSTICDKALKTFPTLKFSVSYTTREERKAEVNGVDYHFVDNETFDKMIEAGEFAEYADVHQKKYGTSKKDLNDMLSEGLSPLLDIDVQGAQQLRETVENAVFIFVLPPSIEECRERIYKRDRGDTEEEIERRLQVALKEIKEAPKYDYILVNDNLDNTFAAFKAVIEGSEDARIFKKNNMLERVEKSFLL